MIGENARKERLEKFCESTTGRKSLERMIGMDWEEQLEKITLKDNQIDDSFKRSVILKETQQNLRYVQHKISTTSTPADGHNTSVR